MAGSDANKSAIVEKGGMDRLIELSARFSDDPSVLQEVNYLQVFIQMNVLDHHTAISDVIALSNNGG